jgi:oligoribonuclease NrnB/cAMP/cGMP phosphodiesterase (DHH superfamily)
MESELIKALINAGTGAIIALVMLCGLYRLADKFGKQVIEAQNRQAIAINDLTNAIKDSMTKDQSEHREIIILLKVISERIERIENNGT